MRFLLINPWIEDSAAFDYWLKPVGLLYVAAILRRYGHEVFLIDCLDRFDEEVKPFSSSCRKLEYGMGSFVCHEIDKPQIIKDIPRKFKRYGFPEEIFMDKLSTYSKQNIDAVLLTTTMTYWYKGTVDTVEHVRRIFPDTPVFLGGIYTNILPEHARSTFSPLNVKVLPGTGLSPVIELLKYFEQDYDSFDWFEELDPAYDLYKSDLQYAVLLSSIGCPYRCSYCMTPNMWSYKYRSVERIKNNVELVISKKSIKDVVFFDDAFLLHPQLQELLEMLSTFETRYHLPNGIHAKKVSPLVAELLKKANFKTIRLGYETSDSSLQKKTGGKVSNADLVNAVGNLKNAGFSSTDIGAYIIGNLPQQNKDDIYNAINFCFDLEILPIVNEYTPIPGTKDHYDLLEQEIFSSDTDPFLLNNKYLPFWWSKGIDNVQMQEIKDYLHIERSKFVKRKAGEL